MDVVMTGVSEMKSLAKRSSTLEKRQQNAMLASFAARSCVTRTLSPWLSRAEACQLLGTLVRLAALLSLSVI